MYSTLENLKTALPERVLLQLTDDENNGEFVLDPPNAAYTRVIEAVKKTDSLIDGYISGRYELPFSSVPNLINTISVNLTICELYERNHEAVLPEAIAERRKANIKTLEKLQSGVVVLPGQSKVEPASFVVNKTDDDRQFPNSLLNMY
jgi:phage gp36-like protein